jgi:hypothetical protein
MQDLQYGIQVADSEAPADRDGGQFRIADFDGHRGVSVHLLDDLAHGSPENAR